MTASNGITLTVFAVVVFMNYHSGEVAFITVYVTRMIPYVGSNSIKTAYVADAITVVLISMARGW